MVGHQDQHRPIFMELLTEVGLRKQAAGRSSS